VDSRPNPDRDELTISVWRQNNGYIAAMIECPAFVDESTLFHDVDEALDWINTRLRSSPVGPLDHVGVGE
jgi:hypothetical protein